MGASWTFRKVIHGSDNIIITVKMVTTKIRLHLGEESEDVEPGELGECWSCLKLQNVTSWRGTADRWVSSTDHWILTPRIGSPGQTPTPNRQYLTTCKWGSTSVLQEVTFYCFKSAFLDGSQRPLWTCPFSQTVLSCNFQLPAKKINSTKLFTSDFLQNPSDTQTAPGWNKSCITSYSLSPH